MGSVCLHVRKPLGQGYVEIVEPGFAGLKYLSLGMLTLAEGTEYALDTTDREAGLTVLGGRCRVEIGDTVFPEVGARPNVFSGTGYTAYLPPKSRVRVKALTDMQAGLCWCRAEKAGKPVLIEPSGVRARPVGRDNWSRTVYDILYEGNVDAQHLIVGETLNPPGNWSSVPPHKHDVHDPPHEAEMEEIYFYKFDPAQGYGFQRLYNDRDLDVAYVLEDGDAVAIPGGYHPVVAGPGYQLYYLWCMAGRGRTLRPKADPKHAWLEQEG